MSLSPKPIKILHLSDFHFCGKDTDPLFIQIVTNYCSEYFKNKVDYLVLSGDFSDQCCDLGIADAKANIPKIIAALGIEKNKVIMCAGNHDMKTVELPIENYLKRKTFELGKAFIESKLESKEDAVFATFKELCFDITGETYSDLREFEDVKFLVRNSSLLSQENKKEVESKELEIAEKDLDSQVSDALEKFGVAIKKITTELKDAKIFKSSLRYSENLNQQIHAAQTHSNNKSNSSINREKLQIVVFHHPHNHLNPFSRLALHNVIDSGRFVELKNNSVAFMCGHTHPSLNKSLDSLADPSINGVLELIGGPAHFIVPSKVKPQDSSHGNEQINDVKFAHFFEYTFQSKPNSLWKFDRTLHYYDHTKTDEIPIKSFVPTTIDVPSSFNSITDEIPELWDYLNPSNISNFSNQKEYEVSKTKVKTWVIDQVQKIFERHLINVETKENKIWINLPNYSTERQMMGCLLGLKTATKNITINLDIIFSDELADTHFIDSRLKQFSNISDESSSFYCPIFIDLLCSQIDKVKDPSGSAIKQFANNVLQIRANPNTKKHLKMSTIRTIGDLHFQFMSAQIADLPFFSNYYWILSAQIIQSILKDPNAALTHTSSMILDHELILPSTDYYDTIQILK